MGDVGNFGNFGNFVSVKAWGSSPKPQAPNPKTFALKFVKESLLRLSLRQVICAD
jgi:hypothetical protein